MGRALSAIEYVVISFTSLMPPELQRAIRGAVVTLELDHRAQGGNKVFGVKDEFPCVCQLD